MTLGVKKVLISDKVDVSCQNVLKQNNIDTDYKPGLSKDELKAIIKDYDALIVRSATKVTPDVFDCADRLKLVGRAGTGVDNIDLNAASAKGVLVMNTPGGNTLSAAEHTCAMISALARHIGQGYASMLEGKWERSKFMGCELGGKTLGIIGLGRIGREVALRMQSYGVKTIGFDPLVSAEEAATFNVESLSLEQIWPIADFVTVHVPLIKPTRGMINKAVFEVCKPGMKVVNVARGGIIDEKDLLEALNNGKCGGAALDVFETEPPKDVSMELVKHPKALCTPHLGASTIEAQLRVAREIAEQIVDANNGKPMFGLVNAPALAEMGNPVFAPWVQLGEKLGAVASAMEKDSNIGTVSVSVKGGADLSKAGKLLVSAVAFGISKERGLAANMISAVSVLRDAGLVVDSAPAYGECHYDELSVVMIGVAGYTKYNGVLTRNTPTISTLKGVQLANPIVLEKGLVVAESTSPDLLAAVTGVNFDSISVGREGDRIVLAASIMEKPATLKEPLKFVGF